MRSHKIQSLQSDLTLAWRVWLQAKGLVVYCLLLWIENLYNAGYSCCLSDRSICFYNSHFFNLTVWGSSSCFCVYQVAFLPYNRTTAWTVSRARKENRTAGIELGQHLRATDVVVQSIRFFHRVIKLYDVCIKWFRQEIHLCPVQHLTSQPPPPFLSLYTNIPLQHKSFYVQNVCVLFFSALFFCMLHTCACTRTLLQTTSIKQTFYFLYFHQQVINTNCAGKRAPADVIELHHAV